MNNDRLLYRRGILQLVASGFFLSTSGIALRIIEQADGWQILFYRSLALSVTILLILVFQKGSRVFDEFRGLEWNDCLLAVFLGTGFVAYVFALLYNTVANALFIFSCAPFVAGFLGWILLGERVVTRTWFAIGGAMAGLTVMVGSELAVSRYLGTLIALWIPIAYAASIIVIRSSKKDNMLLIPTALDIKTCFIDYSLLILSSLTLICLTFILISRSNIIHYNYIITIYIQFYKLFT